MIKKVQEKISSININKLIYIAIFVMLVGFIINGCVLKISADISNHLKRILDNILLVIEGSIILATLALLLIKNPKKIFFIYSFFIIIFLLYYLLFPGNRDAMKLGSKNFFLYNLTSFILFMEASKDEKLFERIIRITKYVFLFAMIYLIILLTKNETLYNLWFSKYFLFTAIFMFFDFYKNKKIVSAIVGLMSLLTLGITGSRAYLIVATSFILLILTILLVKKFKNISISKRKSIVFIIIILSIGIIVGIINYQKICGELYNYSLKSGVEIRILRLLSTGDFLTSNDRINTIYPMSAELIKHNWLFGTGICGDQTKIFERYQQAKELHDGVNVNGYYSHNLILELYSNFGIIISTVIVVIIIYGYYKTIRDKRKNISCIICLSFIGMMPLMLTGTIWNNIYLWSLFGILFANILNKNAEPKENKEKNVVMLLDNAFEPDIRVYKEATFLIKKGYNIEIVCLDKKNRHIDKPIEIYDGIKIKRIFCRTEKTTKLIDNNYIIRKMKTIIYLWWLIKFIIKTKKYLEYKEFEILHCHDLIMAFIGVTFFKNKKVVFDMHEYYGDNNHKIKNLITKKIVQYTQNNSKWIIYVNEFQKEKCKEKNKNKLIEIPNYPEEKNFKNIIKTKNNKIRISYIGKVRDFKALRKLVDCSNLDDRLDIAIYGNGSEYNKILNYLRNKGNEKILKGEYNRHKRFTKYL